MTESLGSVYWSDLGTPIGLVRLFGSSLGLLSVALPNESRADAQKRVLASVGASQLMENAELLGDALRQVGEYFNGTRREFDLSLDVRGTAFQIRVWRAVAQVPYGETRSYAYIARAIGQPSAVRAVGAANGANPLPIVVPCHRIIGKDGALVGYGGGLEAKRWLLERELGALFS